MDKFVTYSLIFTGGVAVGFIAGQFIRIERDEETKKDFVKATEVKTEKKPEIKEYKPEVKEFTKEETEEQKAEAEFPKDDDPSEFVSAGPARIAMPGKPGINYSKVQKIVAENGYTTAEEIEAVKNDPDNQETYEERIEREALEMSRAAEEYKEKNKGKIVPMKEEEWSPDFPEDDFEYKDLYYFVEDDVLTNEEGDIVDEAEYIGTKPRQFGWMNNDNERKIYVKNFPKETNYQVWKEDCASHDFF